MSLKKLSISKKKKRKKNRAVLFVQINHKNEIFKTSNHASIQREFLNKYICFVTSVIHMD